MGKEFTIKGCDMFQHYQHANDFGKDMRLMGNDEMQVSDGYHTMDELYDHRITLYIALCKAKQDFKHHGDARNHAGDERIVWRSKKHSDGEICFGTGTQFVLGISKEKGKQITYHIPVERWSETEFAETLENAPEWDGHSSADVLERISKI